MSTVSLNLDALQDSQSYKLLPDVVIGIVKIIGLKKTMALVEALGGIDMQVPKSNRYNRYTQMLIEAIGGDATHDFCEVYGGDKIYIPSCTAALLAVRNHEFVTKVAAAADKEMTQTEAIQIYARRYGFSERRGYDILKQNRESGQPDLF